MLCTNVQPPQHALGPGCVETKVAAVFWKQTRLLLAHHLGLGKLKTKEKVVNVSVNVFICIFNEGVHILSPAFYQLSK